MLGSLLLLLQLSATSPALQVRTASGAMRLDVTRTASGPAISAHELALALGGTVRTLPTGWTQLTLGALELEFSPDIAFARIGAEIVPLAAAPSLVGGSLLLPAQVATELIPRHVASLRWNAAAGELASTEAPATLAAATRVPAARPAAAERQRVVVVDAGHGGKDPGTRGRAGQRTVLEKDIALAVALAVRDSLVKRGVKVVLTRDDDTFVPLSDRGHFANAHQGDLFLSIHINAANPRARDRALVRGYETYFLAEARTEDAKRVEEMENEVVRFETGADAPKDDPLSFIIRDMAQNEHLRESSDLAEVVQRSLGRMHPGPSRGVKQAGFRVLMTAFMPAVLIEIGFASNPTEAAFISNARRQRELAGAIAKGTMEYLEHYERRVGGSPP